MTLLEVKGLTFLRLGFDLRPVPMGFMADK